MMMECNAVEWNGMDRWNAMQWRGMEWSPWMLRMDDPDPTCPRKNGFLIFVALPKISIFRKWLIFFLFARRVRKWPQQKGVPQNYHF